MELNSKVAMKIKMRKEEFLRDVTTAIKFQDRPVFWAGTKELYLVRTQEAIVKGKKEFILFIPPNAELALTFQTVLWSETAFSD